jgi:periplasmic protein TonB
MMTNIPPVLRLTIFLFLSMGLHGGLAFYEWMSEPSDSVAGVAPVSVSLLPAAKPMPIITTSEPEQAPTPPRKPSRPKLKPKAEPLVEKIEKASFKKNPDAKIVEKIIVASPAPELVCLTPQEPDTEGSPGAVAATSAPVEETVLLASLVTGDVQVVNESPSFANSLVEATPHYRSNPLPEYPRLARKKHWEGVVWLLVDVSADGSVEDLDVEKTCGHKVLDRAAGRTVKRWQFSPATRGGLPVSSQVRIPVRFRLEDG